ncbi:clavesin-1-like isoform X1 [Maniola jurtina]|uniref:clavesin-1-like isoform X1 n=1 Tax=Maniola jurtina TaxID=191418 RepID=UPI001E687746|nr:clavesin-1-like isoform X1 [Maniola jurtina]XP_045770986.1 clavesin-1-like isoform X1 [Maniola jurtina]
MSPMGMKPIQLEDEYSKKTGITPEDIAKLRLWLKTQPHLPEEHITDLDLILAFHCCNRSPELAKQVLDLNLTLRTLFTNYFENRKVDDQIERVFNDILLTVLPLRTSEGYAMLYTHLTNYDPKQFNFGLAIRAVLMTLDLCQSQDGTWPGLLIIVDFEGVTLGHLARLDLQNIQQFLYYVQEAILVRLKGMHFLNAPSFIDKVLLMMKPFLKKQLMDVLHIHTTGSTTVEKFVPIEALPKETGGKYKSYREIQDDVLENMRENKDFFKNESKKRVTEALRPGKPKTITDIFGGVEGSFKKLEID